jgi:acetylglutamate kinase
VSRILFKCGGAVAAEAAPAIRALARTHEVCVVHGAGPQISAELERLGLPVEFVGGRRVTSAAALEVVRRALREVNASLCAAIGPRAIGLDGDEIGLRAERVPALGLVGDPVPTSPRAVEDALAAGLVPVVTPLAEGPLNVNADDAAAALAVGIGAERIVFQSDVPGVLVADEVAESLRAADVDELIRELEGGIVPKLQAAAAAARLGVRAEIGATAVVA